MVYTFPNLTTTYPMIPFAKYQVLSSLPQNGTLFDVVYNLADNLLYYYTGKYWQSFDWKPIIPSLPEYSNGNIRINNNSLEISNDGTTWNLVIPAFIGLNILIPNDSYTYHILPGQTVSKQNTTKLNLTYFNNVIYNINVVSTNATIDGSLNIQLGDVPGTYKHTYYLYADDSTQTSVVTKTGLCIGDVDPDFNSLGGSLSFSQVTIKNNYATSTMLGRGTGWEIGITIQASYGAVPTNSYFLGTIYEMQATTSNVITATLSITRTM